MARPPRVAVISTGNELVPPHVADDEALLVRSLRRHLAERDMIVLTGGVSYGKLDLVRAALDAVGVERVVHQVAQKPGKPMWFGVAPGGQPVFGLPGNPVATLTCLRRYVVPALGRALDASPRSPERLALASAAPTAPRLTHFIPVVLRLHEAGHTVAVPRALHGSGDFLALAGTDGFVELPPSATDLPTAFVADFYRW